MTSKKMILADLEYGDTTELDRVELTNQSMLGLFDIAQQIKQIAQGE